MENPLNELKAVLIAMIQSMIPVLIILGVINGLSDTDVSTVMLFVTNIVTFTFLAIDRYMAARRRVVVTEMVHKAAETGEVPPSVVAKA